MSMNASLTAVDAPTWERLRRDPDLIVDFLEDVDPPRELHLRKMWHALHFLLTGTTWDSQGPVGQAIIGGEDIGPDIGYGPARILAPEEVKATAAALTTITNDQFKSRFVPTRMEAVDIYPSDIWVREKDTILSELLPLFQKLVQFYRDAAARGDGMLLSMT